MVRYVQMKDDDKSSLEDILSQLEEAIAKGWWFEINDESAQVLRDYIRELERKAKEA